MTCDPFRRPFLLYANAVVWTVGPLWLIVNEIHTLCVYGTRLTPAGAGYNFPPLCCGAITWPLFLAVALLPYFAIVRSSKVAADVLWGLMAIVATLCGLVAVMALSDVMYGMPAKLGMARKSMLVALLFTGYFIFSATQVHPLMRAGLKPFKLIARQVADELKTWPVQRVLDAVATRTYETDVDGVGVQVELVVIEHTQAKLQLRVVVNCAASRSRIFPMSTEVWIFLS